jgi:hypothetical protein
LKTLALTVLVHEGPMARSYLGVLRAAGHRVERIVLMVGKRDPASRKPLAPWLPTIIRHPFARMQQDLRMNYWSREMLRRHRSFCVPWLKLLASACEIDESVFRCLTERPDYAAYADTVDEVFCDGLGDPALAQQLARLPGRRAILFTGGGMVPASLLNLPQCRFIHVHPGVLPRVRGADGFLWSVLLRGRPGATAFYMSPGLDTGEIILAQDLPVPPLPAGFADLDASTAYRLVYAFVDPMWRAVMLRRVIALGRGDLFDMPAAAQREGDGTIFHFMNERMRRHAFERMASLAGKVGQS